MRKSATKSRSHASHPPAILDASPPGEELDQPFEESIHNNLDPDLRHQMISEAAYYLYANRNYEDGYDTEDWLTAEEQVDHLLLQSTGRGGTGVETV